MEVQRRIIYIFLVKNMIFLKEKSGKSWATISNESGFSRRTIESIYSNDKCNPRIETVKRIASYFNVSIDDLINKDLSK